LFSGGEFIFCELKYEGVKLLQPPQRIAASGKPPDHLADGLLHWLNFDFHLGKVNRFKGQPSTCVCLKRREFPAWLHVELVLVALGILPKSNRRVTVWNADAARYQALRLRTKIVERFADTANHPG